MKRTGSSKNTINRHFAQKKAELDETFQAALAREFLSREAVNGLGASICGDSTIDYLVLGNATPVAEQYAESVYERIQVQQLVWPFTNKKECPEPQKAREHYVAAYESYSKRQTPRALLAFYKEQYPISRAYLAATALYLTREEKNKKKRESRRPLWKVFWQDLTKQKQQNHAVRLTDPEFAAVLSDEWIRNTLDKGYKEIYNAGRIARDILITKFHALAYKQAKKYMGHGYTMDELVQEATVGIERATQRYDYKRGILFSTYATWWVKAMLNRFTKQYATHVPKQLREAADDIGLYERELRQKHGYEPTDTDLLTHLCTLGHKKEIVQEALKIFRQRTVSLDQESADEEGSTLLDCIPDPHERNLSEEISQHCLTQTMRQAVAQLNPRLRRVIEHRFFEMNNAHGHRTGKDGLVSSTLIGEILAAEDGREHPYSRQRVKQLEEKAFKALRKILKHPEFAYIAEKVGRF